MTAPTEPFLTLTKEQAIEIATQKKALNQCIDALRSSELDSCEKCKPQDVSPSWVVPLAVSGVVVLVAATFIGGVAVGIEVQKPKE